MSKSTIFKIGGFGLGALSLILDILKESHDREEMKAELKEEIMEELERKSNEGGQ